MLEPRKDELVNELAKVLNLSTVPTEYLITLVPVCYVTVGGYSHPAVLDVGRFMDLSYWRRLFMNSRMYLWLRARCCGIDL